MTAPEPQSGDPGPAPKTPRRPLLFRLLGIRRRQGRFLKFGLTLWGWCVMAGVVMVVALGGFAEYSMQPEFCRSCHIMEPYYQAWHSSTHANVPCADCHFEPGLRNTLMGKWQASSQAVKYLTNTYGSKPHAEVRDASCLREGCHEKRILEGKVKWTVASQRGGEVTIRFDHAPHLAGDRRGMQLRCVSCHSQIVQGKHIVVTLDTCFLCHFKGLSHGRHEQTLGGCKACHDAPKGEIRLATGMFDHNQYLGRGVTCENCHSDSVKGDGAVPLQTCWNCHNQSAQIARFSETQFIHSHHVDKHKVECSSCHIQIEHRLSVARTMLRPRGAAADHTAIDNLSCSQCHEQTHGGPAMLYRGTGGRGVPDMPSPMFRTEVDCLACHKSRMQSDATAEFVGQTFRGVQQSCDFCHGNKYSGTLDEWKKRVADHLDVAEAAYKQVKAAADKAKLDAQGTLKVNRLLDDAGHNMRLVKLGHGVHNINYSTAVLNVAIERCQDAAKVLGVPAPTTTRAKP